MKCKCGKEFEPIKRNGIIVSKLCVSCRYKKTLKKPIKKESERHKERKKEVAKIKSTLEKKCAICGLYGNDAAHLLPKSLFEQHYTDKRNIVIMCRKHHNLYDNSLEYRQKQTELFKRACEINEKDAHKYFRL